MACHPPGCQGDQWYAIRMVPAPLVPVPADRPSFSHRLAQMAPAKDGKLHSIRCKGRRPKERMAIMAEETYTFRCTVCGWEVTVDTPELPDDFVCEVCGVGPEMFELVEE